MMRCRLNLICLVIASLAGVLSTVINFVVTWNHLTSSETVSLSQRTLLREVSTVCVTSLHWVPLQRCEPGRPCA